MKERISIMLLLYAFNTQCMFQRPTYYAAKYIPAILKKVKPSSTVPAAHIISNIDGSPVSQGQFDEIKTEILTPNEFPTALVNPNYNPDADETKVIQKKLDEKYSNDLYKSRLYDPFGDHNQELVKKTKVSWIPQTLHDLFAFKYSESKYDEHVVNQKINTAVTESLQQPNEADATYYKRLATPFVEEPFLKICDISPDRFFYHKNLQEIHKNSIQAINNTIEQETVLHKEKPDHVFLYRGHGAADDFNKSSAKDVGKKGIKSLYADEMAHRFYWGIPAALSYGLSLLSNAKKDTGEIPFEYAFLPRYIFSRHSGNWDSTRTRKNANCDKKYKHQGNLQLLPVKKADFNKPEGLWYVNPKYGYFASMYAGGVTFHPRAKGHSYQEHAKNELHGSLQDGLRYTIHSTAQQAYQKLVELKKYQIHNAIGATDYTKHKIEEAQKAYQKGEKEKNTHEDAE